VQEDGTGFHVRNGGTQETLRTVRRSYGYKLQQRLMVDSMKAGYTVVCYLPALLIIPGCCLARYTALVNAWGLQVLKQQRASLKGGSAPGVVIFSGPGLFFCRVLSHHTLACLDVVRKQMVFPADWPIYMSQ
jgi:hypothetical protein